MEQIQSEPTEQQADVTVRLLGVKIKESALRVAGKYLALLMSVFLAMALVIQTNRLKDADALNVKLLLQQIESKDRDKEVLVRAFKEVSETFRLYMQKNDTSNISK